MWLEELINDNEKTGRMLVFPHPLLKEYIAHYTILKPQKGPVSQPYGLTLIPDAAGCLVIQVMEREIKSTYWGPTTKTVEVKGNDDEVLFYFFVEFLPTGAYTLLGLPQIELTDKTYLLEDVSGSLERVLTEFLQGAKNQSELIEKVNRHFLDRLQQKKDTEFIRNLNKHMALYEGKLRTKDLEELSNYSARHLNRLFYQNIGMNMKTYNRLLRINLALKMIGEKRGNLTQLAMELGYYDQSHFIKDFSEICGVSPTEYIKNMSVFYNENHKF